MREYSLDYELFLIYNWLKVSHGFKVYNLNFIIDYKFYFHSEKKFKMFINVGTLLEVPFKTYQWSDFNTDEEYYEVSNDEYHSKLFSANVGIGLKQNFSRSFSIEINPFLQYDLNQFFVGYETLQPISVGALIALNYHFKRKRL